MLKKSLLICGILFAFTAWAKSPDLSEMTAEEKELTGLNKLNEEELNALASWLKNEQLKINRKMRERQAGFEAKRGEGQRRTIRARVEKTYNDKLGETFYELDNGQIWKRASSGTIFLKKDGRQLVTIEPAAMGSWELRGDGNRSVKVKRIK
ncbi:hypothetical protein OS175_11720 [Marinicella sp. S1101]|uniref:hypothetical protein n=1 Tax=Marinicella marina TaxID=2996016 RepID=UPI002260E13D|nr:hypothetical protein [Marinicella marina]MCX7554550.1 hypothetical protein [Marinicella marina]MDJ1141066.1 hypothetical protein [Marinicella marina]